MCASVSLVVRKENYIYVKYWDKMAEAARRDGEHEQKSRTRFNLLKCLWEELMWPRPTQISPPVDCIDLTSSSPCRDWCVGVNDLTLKSTTSWRVWTCLVTSLNLCSISDQTHTDPRGSIYDNHSNAGMLFLFCTQSTHHFILIWLITS